MDDEGRKLYYVDSVSFVEDGKYFIACLLSQESYGHIYTRQT